MGFEDRSEFIAAQASEKITLAQVEANAPLREWTLVSGNVYEKIVPYYTINMFVGETELSLAADANVTEGEWFYDSVESKVTIHVPGGGDPGLVETIVRYQFHYSDAPVTASYDLTNTGKHVHYEGRIRTSPGYKHKIGTEQKLTSIIGSGVLKLENTDAGLDDIFDTLFFENREVRIYSWNRQLDFDSARIIFRGRITNKTYTDSTVEFRIKDNLFDLEQPVPLQPYTDDDDVNEDIKGRYKRWVYGRVDGLKLQSIDQIGDGYSITGTFEGTPASTTLTGTGTTLLADVSPGDLLTIGTQEFTIESVQSDTTLTVDTEPSFAFTLQPATLKPDIPTTVKNRDFFVAGHESATLSTTVTSLVQFNRVGLANTTGFSPGDFVEFATGERIEIKNIDTVNNIIVLQQNVIVQPSVGSTVIRQPVQQLFVEGDLVNDDDFSLTNSTVTTISFDSDTEFNLARTQSFGFDATFTNGSRTVTTTDDIDLREILSPRDFIRPTDITFTTFYEILQVEEQSLELRVNFADPNHTGSTEGKKPNYIGDDTVVSGNVLGKTANGLSSGEWLQTAGQVVLDLLTELNITAVDTASFDQADEDNRELLSIALPLSPTGSLPTTKSVVDIINKSVNGSLTLDNDLQLKYKILLAELDPNLISINDNDVVRWSIKSTSNESIRNSLIKYRHQDVLRSTLESGSNAISFSSDFVKNYIGTNKTNELDVYLYNVRSARVAAHRDVYYRSLSRADITIDTDLRLENVEIGHQVQLEFDRLYKRLGDPSSSKKVAVVVGKQVTGQNVRLELTDLGNIYNRTAIITDNAAPDYSASTEDEKLTLGFITDNRGIIDDDETTLNVNLIN